MPSIIQTWTTDRIEALKIHFAAGLSCREIAAEIGVSRNAVIGKISRLSLSRDKDVMRVTKKETAGVKRPRGAQRLRQILLKSFPSEAEPAIEDESIHNGHTCSLFELSNETCRWPISTPGQADFCFCGNTPIEGMPYCPGHSRLAYRVSAR
ncbi:MAG TPA: GcrA family cell cycle regulator [Bradyrhizobium sp.]|jgi:GcrA cell cycle regulator|nr:GcrA family cell cycle regulator [Bradyrhizobium sp.]